MCEIEIYILSRNKQKFNSIFYFVCMVEKKKSRLEDYVSERKEECLFSKTIVVHLNSLRAKK